MNSLKLFLQIGCLICLSLFSLHIHAEIKIAILQFELKDLTLAPRIPAEIERTASITIYGVSVIQSMGSNLWGQCH